MNRIIVIIGPTASGKTSLTIELSKYADIEVISSDSRQVYKYLDIGTAKPSTYERALVRHHLIDFLNPDEYYSAGRFANDAEEIILNVISRGKIPVIAGGSGLYIQALCEGFFDDKSDIEKRKQIREVLYAELSKNGKDVLFDKLRGLDPEAASLYSDKNSRRVIRALEYILLSGKKFSDSIKNKSENKFQPLYFGINFERKELYNRINLRVDKMIEEGLVSETENVLKLGFSKDLNSLNTVGYKEIINYLEGVYSLEFAIEEIKKNTRRYAKRQITWFKRYNEAIWFDTGKIDYKTIIKNYYEN